MVGLFPLKRMYQSMNVLKGAAIYKYCLNLRSNHLNRNKNVGPVKSKKKRPPFVIVL